MRGFLVAMPGGDWGTRATVAHMARLARQAAPAPIVRTTAARLVFGLTPAEADAQCREIGEWVGQHTMFLPDPSGVEALHDPAWLVREALTRGVVQCDCDDVAMLAAAMGLSVGLRARFVVVGFHSPNSPYQHVWTELAGPRPGASWWSIDPTRPAQGLGALPISRALTVEV